MREEGQDWLDELAAAVADGQVVDWDSLESSASTDDRRRTIRRLRAIAAIGQAHAELTLSDTASDSLSVRSQLPGVDDPSTPANWGPLRILERVGRGRFGDVYRAWDPNLDREVALKLLRRRDAEAVSDKHVIEEGRLMARVRHPNVATIHGAQRIDGRIGLWMEFVQGRTLEAELQDGGPFPVSELVDVGRQLCRALTAVHDAGLVHRDVKAQNVLRDAERRVVLGDFGTGYEVETDGTGPTDLAGTPSYLAPEIFARAPASVQSDLYSLGVLLFHLATGTYPVTGGSLRQIGLAHKNQQRAALADLRADLPDSLVAAIERATEPDAARRFQSARAFESALEEVFGSNTEATAAGRRPWSLIGASVVAIAGLAVWALSSAALRDPDQNEGGNNQSTLIAPPGSRAFRQIGGSDLAGPGVPSPDGRVLSIVDVATGELAFHDVATGKQSVLTGPQSGDPPGYVEGSRFSLDGSRVTYVRFVPQADPTRPGIPEIRSIPSAGGRSRLLWRGSDERYVNFYHWAGDDDLILVSRWPECGRGELLLISTADGVVRASHELRRTPSLTGASLSPDGRFVAYEQADPATDINDIHLWNVGTDSTTTLIRDASTDESPIWTADGRYLLFMSNRSGIPGLWAQRMEDGSAVGVPIRLDPNLGADMPMGGLTNSGSLFVRREIGTRDVFVVDIDPATLQPIGEPTRATDVPRFTTGTSAWSPDGTSLAFFRRDAGRRSLVVRSMVSGKESEHWRPGVGGLVQPRWEPGGHSILFKGTVDEKTGLHRLDLATGTIVTVLDRCNLGNYEALPVPGFVVVSDRLKREIIRVDLHTGRREVIHRLQLPATLGEISLSNRGDRLAYSLPMGGKGVVIRILDLASPATAREIFRTAGGTGATAYAWSGDDRELIVRRNVNADGKVDGKSHVWAIDVSTGKARTIGLTVDRGLQMLRISPDGRRLSYDAGFPYQEVWVLENVAAALPR